MPAAHFAFIISLAILLFLFNLHCFVFELYHSLAEVYTIGAIQMSQLRITSRARLKSRLKETVSPNSVGFIVSMKGLSGAPVIVFFKGESGYRGNLRMPTARRRDGERRERK